MEDDAYRTMMKSWIECSKSCSQLATAAMFLPVFYVRELVANTKDAPIGLALNNWFMWSWALLIISIALSFVYQVSATKLLSTSGQLMLFPRTQFWAMLGALVVGLALFATGALHAG